MNSYEHSTSDIQIAAFLLAQGIEFKRIDKTNPRRSAFVFNNEPRIPDLITAFWQESIKLAPRKYMGAYKELKNRLYQ